jgi:hypothetical protein
LTTISRVSIMPTRTDDDQSRNILRRHRKMVVDSVAKECGPGKLRLGQLSPRKEPTGKPER